MSRFICLKIWPRLPNQSKRALQMLNTADSKEFISKELLDPTHYVLERVVPYYGSAYARQEGKRTESTASDAQMIGMYQKE